jgi:TonB family protein
VIKRVVLTRKGAYQNCYERQLQAKRDLNGTISVAVMVSGTNGKVLLARVVRTSMNNTAVENCLVGQIKKLRFPAPKNGKTVKFTYPFRFKPS